MGHRHTWQPRSDLGMAMYECVCGDQGKRVLSTGAILVVPVKVPEAPTAQPTEQPVRRSVRHTDGERPRRVHTADSQDWASRARPVGSLPAFNPTPAYRRVCVALMETKGLAPTRDVAELANCSETFVRKVIDDIMHQDV